MTRRTRPVFFGLAFLILQAWTVAIGAAELSGTPEVIDGDTLVLAGTTVRLAGIDAPEIGQRCAIGTRTYNCGTVARTALLDLLAGSIVTCEPLEPSADGGVTGRCTAGNYDLSEGMAYTGWALTLPDAWPRYKLVEASARQHRRGLWKGDFIAPWDWRTGARLPQETSE